MSKSLRRRGFTLPEVLVTVTIVAVLAAVMVPAVINQVAKGDEPAIAQDLTGIRTAITTFAADTRRFPEELSDLGLSTLADTAKDILGNDYGADAANNYRGPYAPITQGHRMPNGAIFSNALTTLSRAICMVDSVDAGGASLVTAPQIEAIKKAIDQNAASATSIAANNSTGTDSTGQVHYSLENNTGVITVIPGTVRVCVTSY